MAAATWLATKAALVFTAGIVVGSCLTYAVDHDCDETLTYKWLGFYKNVMIENRPALIGIRYTPLPFYIFGTTAIWIESYIEK